MPINRINTYNYRVNSRPYDPRLDNPPKEMSEKEYRAEKRKKAMAKKSRKKNRK